jgi:ketosteroid isomerase-like protein
MYLRLLIFLLVVPLLSSAQQKADEDAIRQLLLAQRDAWNNGDMEGYMLGYWQSDSLTFVGKLGITRGWRPTLDNYKKSYPNKDAMGQLDFHFEKIELLGEQEAFVLCKWRLERSDGQLSGYFTLRLHKFEIGWRVVLDHSS